MYGIKKHVNHKNGDCYILNTDNAGGQHWFCVLVLEHICFLFDCSLLTPPEAHKKVLAAFPNIPVSKQIAQLQGIDALTCGEHCIAFLCNVVNASLHNEDDSMKHLAYAAMLRKVSAELNISCDQYVTDFVYTSNLFDIKTPSLRETSDWLGNMGV